MSVASLDAIKESIAGLPRDQKTALLAWLNHEALNHETLSQETLNQEAAAGDDDWDREMKQDFSPGGRGQRLVDRVKAQVERGEFIPFRRDEAV